MEFLKGVCVKIKQFLIRHWYDVLFAIVIIVAIGLDVSFLMGVMTSDGLKYFYQWFDDNNVYQIFSLIAPILDTIVSTIVATSTIRICNLSYRDFRLIRGKYEYNPFSIELISILLLVLSVAASIFKMAILVISTTAISLFYAIYFICSDIPILSLNGKRIGKIIAKNYKIDYTKVDALLKRTYEEKKNYNMIRIISYLIIKYGLDNVFELILRENKSGLNPSAVSINLISRLDDTLNCYQNGLCNPLESSDIQVQDISHNAIQSINNLLNFNSHIYQSIVSENDCRFIDLMNNTIFDLELVVETYGFDKMYKYNMEFIFIRLLPERDKAEHKEHKEKEIKTATEILSFLLIHSLSEENLFVYGHFNTIFAPHRLEGMTRNPNYFIFSSIYLFFAMSNETLSDAFHDSIKDFISNVGHDNLHMYLAQKSMYFNTYFCVDLLKDLIKFQSVFGDDNYWNISGHANKGTASTKPFRLKYIYDWWFAFLLTDSSLIIRDTYDKLVSSLTSDQLQEIKDAYNKNWKGKTQEEIDEKSITQYFKLLGFAVSIDKFDEYEDFFSNF